MGSMFVLKLLSFLRYWDADNFKSYSLLIGTIQNESMPSFFYPTGGKKVLIQCPCFLLPTNLLNRRMAGSCLFGLWLGY